MDRRRFVGAAVAAGLGLPAGANPDEDDDFFPRVAPFGPVSLTVRGRQVLISAVIVATSTGAFACTFRGEVPQFDENRVATSGLLGGITRPTPRERVQGSLPVGRVVVVGTNLVVLPDDEFVPPGRTVILHGDRSWEPPRVRRAQVPGLADIPALGRLFRAGAARSTSRELIVLVSPVITLDDGEF